MDLYLDIKRYSYFCEQKTESFKKYGCEEIFRRTGKDSPVCQGNGTSCPYSYTSILGFAGKLLFGDIHEELPIAKATVSQHLKELKEAGLIQGEIEAPKVKYCINKENWEIAQSMFAGFWKQSVCKKKGCCKLASFLR